VIQLRDPARLRARANELAARADADPRAVAERRAAAEAYLRLAVLDTQGDARALLRRVVELDPYRVEGWLLLGRAEHDGGSYAHALEHFDFAALLAPGDPRIALARARTQIRVAAVSSSAKQADAALEALAKIPSRPSDADEELLVGIAATIHASAKRMREELPARLARVPVTEALRSRVTPLLYLAVSSLSVGSKHDDRNREVLTAITTVVDRYKKAGIADADMQGAAVAAAAKRCTAAEICDRVDVFARDIPDVRFVRLLLRERLATVDDPSERLALFERAMEKIPTLDGITHDYLQLLHLVAKRAVATGDLEAARSTWQACLEVDPDNLAVVENLRQLASTLDDSTARAALDGRIAELRRIYAEYSPRADIVMARASAALLVRAEETLAELTEGERTLDLAEAPGLLRSLARSAALGRAAHDSLVRGALPAASLALLLDPNATDAECFELATQVLNEPLLDEVPTAYALLDITKDASPALIAEARTKVLEELDRMIERDPDPDRIERRARVERETAVLLEPSSRSAYDAVTTSVEIAEMLRHYVRVVGHVTGALVRSPGADVNVRAPVVAMLRRIIPDHAQPYATLDAVSERSFEARLGSVLCNPVIELVNEAVENEQVERAIDLLRPYTEHASSARVFHDAMAHLLPRDPRPALEEVITATREHARKACSLSDSPSEVMTALATEPEVAFRERIATQRGMFLLGREQFRPTLEAYWTVHPDASGTMPTGNPPGVGWDGLKPTGRLRYAFAVAQALRITTIGAYNNTNPWSRHALLELKHNALVALRASNRWVDYVFQRADDEEDIDAELGEDIREAAARLKAQLQEDRVHLMEGR